MGGAARSGRRTPGVLGVTLIVTGLGSEHTQEPVTKLLLLAPHPGKHGEDVPVEIGLRDAGKRKPGDGVAEAAMVGVLPLTRLGLLGLQLAGDRVTAMAASDFRRANIPGLLGGQLVGRRLGTSEVLRPIRNASASWLETIDVCLSNSSGRSGRSEARHAGTDAPDGVPAYNVVGSEHGNGSFRPHSGFCRHTPACWLNIPPRPPCGRRPPPSLGTSSGSW